MDLTKISIGSKAPKIVNAIVEIPKLSHNKYEYRDDQDVFELDRVLFSAVHYPFDYGFIPETHCEDEDHLDIMIMVHEPSFVGCLVQCRPIGFMEMIDHNGMDEKILAVPAVDPRFDYIKDIKDIDPHALKEITNFFETYKILEKKSVKVGEWHDAQAAYEIIEKTRQDFLKLKK